MLSLLYCLPSNKDFVCSLLSVMNKGTDFYVSRLRVCCSMVLSITLPRSAAFRVFCIASSLYSSLTDFCSGERRLFLSLRRRNHLVSDVDRRETGLFPRKTKTSLPGSFFFKKNANLFNLVKQMFVKAQATARVDVPTAPRR